MQGASGRIQDFNLQRRPLTSIRKARRELEQVGQLLQGLEISFERSALSMLIFWES